MTKRHFISTELGTTMQVRADPRIGDLEDRILDVVREKRLSFSQLQKAEKEAGVPSGTKPTVEQLQAVLAALEGM